MAQALYRKWRSQTFGELVGQEPVTRTLRNAVASGRTTHAYLFCGPRGTGKTSTGRILAKALNCLSPREGEPCNECRICQAVSEGRLLDLVEVDAASNRGIDEIRELRDKIRFAPTEARYKVYIVDEVHMLTDQAFNALLKTLEEPPPHAVFILATTEAHKLPATIISRCQRFDFRRIRSDAAIGRLQEICVAEGITADDAALGIIVRNAGGSLRDAENLLDQLVSFYGQHFGPDEVRDLLGLAGDERSRAVVAAALGGELASGLSFINDVASDGVDLRLFNREIVETLRRVMLIQSGAGDLVDASDEERSALDLLASQSQPDRVIRITRLFSDLDLRNDALAGLPLELALYDACAGLGKNDRVVQEQSPSQSSGYTAMPLAVALGSQTDIEASLTAAPRASDSARSNARPQAGPYQPTGDLPVRWRELQTRIKTEDLRVGVLLTAARPIRIDDSEVVCVVDRASNLQRIERERAKILAVLETLYGHAVGFVCQHQAGSTTSDSGSATDPRAALIQRPLVQHMIRKYQAQVALEAED